LGKQRIISKHEGETKVRALVHGDFRITIPETVRQICGITSESVLEIEANHKTRDRFTVRKVA
jgi:bifunctional DNA-binding transcriptional regulator/antitoxin component of YhaV-PrlF toxin-antitoxin module